MNSKKSFSRLSGPWMAENFKSYWLGSALAFLAYFCACCLPILLNFEDRYFKETMLNLNYLPVAALSILIPLVAAILIYRYIQQQSAVAIVHSLPYSRKQLFNSSYLSGIILCIAPIIVTGLILIVLSLAGHNVNTVFDPTQGFIEVNVFPVTGIIKWILVVSLANISVFTVVTFAAVLSGNSLIQAVLSMFLLAFWGLIIGIYFASGEIFLYGFVYPEWLNNVFEYFCPVVMLYAGAGTAAVLVIVAWTIGLYLLTYILYGRRKMEKVNETLVFNKTKPIFKVIIAFIAMECFAFLFYGLSNDRLIFYYIGAVVGAVIGYAVCDMLIQKRIKIQGFAKGFTLFAVVAAIIVVGFSLDITGYEKNVPDVEKIKSATINGFTLYFDESELSYKGFPIEGAEVADKALAEEFTAFHKDIIDNKGLITRGINEEPLNNDYRFTSVRIDYRLGNNRTMHREYYVPMEWAVNNEHLLKVMESQDFKNTFYAFFNRNIEDINFNNVSIENQTFGIDFGKNPVQYTDQEIITKFFNAAKADFSACSGKDMAYEVFNGVNREVYLSFSVFNGDRISPEINKMYYDRYGHYYDEEYNQYSFSFNKSFVNLTNLMKELGIYNNIMISVDDVSFMTVMYSGLYEDNEKYGVYDEAATATEEYGYGGNAKVVVKDREIVENGAVKITDRATMQQILDTANTDVTYANDYYEIAVYPKNYPTNTDLGYSFLFYEQDAPEFIKNIVGR